MTVETWNLTDSMDLISKKYLSIFNIHWVYDLVKTKPWFRLTRMLKDQPDSMAVQLYHRELKASSSFTEYTYILQQRLFFLKGLKVFGGEFFSKSKISGIF